MKIGLLSCTTAGLQKIFSVFFVTAMIFFSGTFLAPDVVAQSTPGITNVPDTSYTTYSAYIRTKKDYPDIRIVTELRSDKVSESRGITYCDLNGRKLKTDAFFPSGKATSLQTAIVIIHGGGWRSGNRSQHYPLAQKLALLGYVCFTPEYRLSTEALFPAAVYDVKAAIRWVRKHAADYHVDTSKIVVLGFSAGGELAAFMGTTGNLPLFEGTACDLGHRSNANAVVDIDGTLSFVHPETGEGDDSRRTSAGTYWFGYSKTEKPELWRIASPLTYADKQCPPVLFLNSSVAKMHAGRNDYVELMNKYGIYTEVHELENSPHSFCLFDPWFDPTVKYIDEFLKKVFK